MLGRAGSSPKKVLTSADIDLPVPRPCRRPQSRVECGPRAVGERDHGVSRGPRTSPGTTIRTSPLGSVASQLKMCGRRVELAEVEEVLTERHSVVVHVLFPVKQIYGEPEPSEPGHARVVLRLSELDNRLRRIGKTASNCCGGSTRSRRCPNDSTRCRTGRVVRAVHRVGRGLPVWVTIEK